MNGKKSKRQYLWFGIFTVITQAMMWSVFSVMNYLSASGTLFSQMILPIAMIGEFILPISAYSLLDRKFFSEGKQLADSISHTVIWIVTATVIATPFLISIRAETWTVIKNVGNYPEWFKGKEYERFRIFIVSYTLLILAVRSITAFIKTMIKRFGKKKSRA